LTSTAEARPKVATELPLLALRSTLVYPLGTIAVQMGAPENLALLRANPDAGLVVALAVAAGEADETDPQSFVGRVAVAVRVHERINLPGGTVQVTLEGLERIIIDDITVEAPFPIARVLPAPAGRSNGDSDALVTRALAAAEALAGVSERVSREAAELLRMNVSDPSRFADLAATHLEFRIADRDQVLQRVDVGERLAFIVGRLEKELERARVLADVRKKTEHSMAADQRQQFLRQQLRTIQAELGEADPAEREALALLKKIDAAGLSAAAADEARREVERLRGLTSNSSESQVVRAWLDWLLALPWAAPDRAHDIDLGVIEAALDGRHWGLREAKERIVEYLAVRKLKGGDAGGPILCFVGPPGTGKTSLGEAIAAAIGRQFYRISVGGVRDEAEIRGHRRTYVGAMPGLVLQAMRRAGVRDPVLMIDEVDKMSSGGATGDPAAAMLEVLDPSQNRSFTDHYLNLPFDLSSALFICTANSLFDIPHALRDRLEVIRIAGYTVEEKVEIAWRYLLPRLLDEHGLTELDLQFTDEVLSFVATRYAREAGLRTFERTLASVMRKRARAKADGEQGAWVMDNARLEELLGAPSWPAPEAEQAPEVGTVTGLAWTATGGDLMEIEALRMPGTGKLTVTGQLGDVMRESVDAAHSFVRSRAQKLAINEADIRGSDLHIHFPQGSVPKDGPSAGVAVTIALASVLSGRAVRRDVGVTGEVTLRGKVLEVGGIKEKILAAYRAGLREVLLPDGNRKDLRDVPEEVRTNMRFTFVTNMDDVLPLVLLSD
jgi:ATP-dependent Lon protease